MDIPIQITSGITLNPTSTKEIARIEVNDFSSRFDLSWDRFVRLKRSADALQSVGAQSILDAGGFDGAIAFFLNSVEIDLIDPATTGGSVLPLPVSDGSYEAVVAVDLLEHIKPELRGQALREFARVARNYVVLNYPSRDSQKAQALMLELTNNSLIREHVEWELPESAWVVNELRQYGFQCVVTKHTSIATWMGQYLVQNLLPEQARSINKFLVTDAAEEPAGKCLYELIVCRRADV